MMRENIAVLLFLACAGLLTVAFRPTVEPADSPRTVMTQMLAATDKVKTLEYTLMKWERINGKMMYEKSDFRYQRKPFSVYMKMHEPRKVEVIFVEGWNGNKAKVNAGSLIPNLSLDIDGSQMRENQHHNLYAAGFDFQSSILRALMNKYGDKADQMAEYLGKFTWNGMTCHKVVLNSDDFGYRDYTVAAGETVFSIAKKYNLSEHMILEANKLKSYTGLTTGQKLKLPTIYAKKTELLIDVATMLPVKTLVYDDQGLYERYEYYNLKLNPTLSANAFSTDNPAYGF